jgi:hypothetical protein
LTVGYVGQHGTHLVVPMPYFQRQLINGQVLPSPYLSGNRDLVSKITQISGTASVGNQRYDGLQAELRKRFSSGLEYGLAYTWSHGMSDAIGYYGEGGQAGSQSAYWQNLYNQRAEWGPTYFDAKHMFVGSFFYELPVGKGKALGAGWNRAIDAFVGGWQLGGILTMHTGFPLTVTAADVSGTLSRGARANVIGTPDNSHKVGIGNHWLDPGAFAQPLKNTFGNEGIGSVRGPGLARFDMTLGKRFAITEAKAFEFRAEAYNLTNTPIFNGPVRNINATNFGEISGTQGERNMQLALKFYF